MAAGDGDSPRLLRSQREIARTFGVRRQTVRAWREKGAPIAVSGGRMKALLADLQRWLVAFSRRG